MTMTDDVLRVDMAATKCFLKGGAHLPASDVHIRIGMMENVTKEDITSIELVEFDAAKDPSTTLAQKYSLSIDPATWSVIENNTILASIHAGLTAENWTPLLPNVGCLITFSDTSTLDTSWNTNNAFEIGIPIFDGM